MSFLKDDENKPRPSLLPLYALLSTVKVLGHGARKYAPNNWRKCDDPTRYLDAALRHIFAHQMGEFIDPESGQPHLAHAICCLMFMLELLLDPAETDGAAQ